MSEYQYYEFLAVDKPLTEQQQAELRELSTRAEITSYTFVNEYNWGNFRGDPQQMMERYFDAFLYLANWGTRQLMFRLPRILLDPQVAELYCYTTAASLTETDDYLIISLYADREPDDDWYETSGQLGAMVQARSDLAAGDLRLLYLAWLFAIQWDEVDDEDTEPPVPAGLANLSASLRAIAEFLDIDEDLMAVAAEGSPDAGMHDDGGNLAEWIATLATEEKDKLLSMVAKGEATQAQALLLRRYRDQTAGPNLSPVPARTAAELWKAAGSVRRSARGPRNSDGEKRRRAKPPPGLPRTRDASTNWRPALKKPGRRSTSS